MTARKALLRLSWPARPLWQNRRAHWAQVHKATAAAKNEAAWTAAAQTLNRDPDPRARLTFEFHPPDRKKRDMQNMPATMKPAIDGIAQAMGVDDSGFRCVWPEAFSEVVPGGCVIVTVEVGEP